MGAGVGANADVVVDVIVDVIVDVVVDGDGDGDGRRTEDGAGVATGTGATGAFIAPSLIPPAS
jgi:hypothetical protein